LAAVMGANQSTRNITVVNDEASGVIKISDAVVERLKGEISGEAQAPAAAPAPAAALAPAPAPDPAPAPAPPAAEPTAPAPEIAAPAAPEIPAPSVPAPAAAAAVPAPAAAVPAPAAETPAPAAAHHVWQRPIIQYIEEPSLSALRVRTEKEEELRDLELYWRERLAGQEQEHVHREQLTQKQVVSAAELVTGLFLPAAPQGKDICREASEAVKSCYTSNPQQSLLCREKVLHFSQCVTTARSQLVTPSG